MTHTGNAMHTNVAMTLLMMTRSPNENRRIAGAMSFYWVNFMRTGDPNWKGLAHWLSASEQPGGVFEVGERFAVIPVASDKAKLAFFAEHLMKGKR